jgi:sugar lactone lactonase YvrE
MSPEMRLLRSFGRIGDGDGEFRFPSGLAFSRSSETLYVVDPWAARVQAFDLEGRFLFSWSRWGSGAPFMRPGAIAAGRDGSVYVTDALADRVIRFDEQGRYLSDWGGRGTEVGRFWIPTGIGQDREERIFVLDYGNHRVQIFSPQGEWLVSFGMGRAFTRASPPRPP